MNPKQNRLPVPLSKTDRYWLPKLELVKLAPGRGAVRTRRHRKPISLSYDRNSLASLCDGNRLLCRNRVCGQWWRCGHHPTPSV